MHDPCPQIGRALPARLLREGFTFQFPELRGALQAL
ncbi:MAG: DUF1731 domain-containing protein [Phycisphaerales bacterium]|nr:DUF1731 domain-containing protein [Phycisphaerales bacterium]